MPIIFTQPYFYIINAPYGVSPLSAEGAALLLRMDGEDGSTVFTDELGNTISRYGNVRMSTTTAKFGTSSAYFDGAGDYLVMPVSSSFGFGTGDFTIELWFNCTNGAKQTGALFDMRDPGNWQAMKPTIIFGARQVYFSSAGVTKATSAVLPDNTWHHVAHTRSGGISRYFINGVLIGTVADTNNYGSASDAVIGQVSEARTTWDGYFAGYIDDVRVMKGTAAYTASFTPPGNTAQ